MTDAGIKYRFGSFILDESDRQLWMDGSRVNLNDRYLSTLILLIQEQGQLVSKNRLFDEVWSDVVVSDSALTQCIKEIRKVLEDNAVSPRFIQTVPRHGYRFIAPVTLLSALPEERSSETIPHAEDPIAEPPVVETISAETISAETISAETISAPVIKEAAWFTVAGTVGGGLAGIFGGLLYGSALGYTPAGPELGTASILLVALSVNMLVGLIGGLGISLGMSIQGLVLRQPAATWNVLGAGLGGFAVGGLSKLLGVDAFTLFFGQTPAGITGGLEGAALGVFIALGAKLSVSKAISNRFPTHWKPVWGGAIGGGLAGVLIPISGGNLMGGSLQLIAQAFADSQLELDSLGSLFGEIQFGMMTQAVLGGVEGLLFGSFLTGAIIAAQRIKNADPM